MGTARATKYRFAAPMMGATKKLMVVATSTKVVMFEGKARMSRRAPAAKPTSATVSWRGRSSAPLTAAHEADKDRA